LIFYKTFFVAIILLAGFQLSGLAKPNDNQQEFNIAGYEVEVLSDLKNFKLSVNSETIEDSVTLATFKITSEQYEFPPEFNIKWSLPFVNVAGLWKPNSNADKSLPPDWSNGGNLRSFVTYQSPVECLYGYNNSNRLTFACSDALNTLITKCGVREEDAKIYCNINFFSEKPSKIKEYKVVVRFDKRNIPYYQSLNDVSKWWASMDGFQPTPVPNDAEMPMYSTWYSYHQSVNESKLLGECKIAKQLGCKTIIVDDGWQTLDSNRGYAYTGDWKPERMTHMKEFVDSVHSIGMKAMLWYSVPYVGIHSENFEKFKNKFLGFKEGNKWGKLDPRYPDVRDFIIDTYVRALKDWNLDGFKLDFIDQFRVYEGTDLEAADGRDIASVYDAVDTLMTNIMQNLKKINPNILIEFRQNYVGPLMRKYGNMFRASDCPNSAFLNRHRTTQVKLLCGNTAVHSDMIMWNYNEPVEIAAIQFTNIMFAVPQISVRLADIPKDHLQMLKFMANYWIENRETLLQGEFSALYPSAGYPILISTGKKKVIVGVYDNEILDMKDFPLNNLDIINGKATDYVVLKVPEKFNALVKVYSCIGNLVSSKRMDLNAGLNQIDVPVSGIVMITK
jgi:alpha-galactosidase